MRRRPSTLSAAEWAAAERTLSSDERLRLDHLDSRGAQSFLGGRLLLRELAAELLGIDAAEVPLSAPCIDCGLPHGRPVIAGSALHVTLAHSVDVVVAAASWDASIGIDIEAVAGSPERLDAVEALTGHRSLQHWTRVEAVLKADGRGLRVDPRRVRVTTRGTRVEGAIEGSRMRYRILDLSVGPASIGSVAIELSSEAAAGAERTTTTRRAGPGASSRTSQREPGSHRS